MPPFTVIAATTLLLLLAATFLVVPVVGWLRGSAAQEAAEADVAAHGHAPDILRLRRVDFGASRASVVIACSIGVVSAVLGVLDLAGSGPGRVASWVFAAVMVVLGCVIMPGEVFTTRYVEAAFKKADVRGIDVASFVDAARRAYPSWFGVVVAARFGLATAGSVLVIVLLALPASGAYFG